ncbi:hypothetical protein [Ulvibacterium marinum]|uniref:Uncharacterized protein n=1 Tax=Ulvibacterium marinum TaxID=2419782 RepID=A0A3B0C636_9FLAO|nr:hypothetical protein [Ulvibacterium marinum]RKN81052.1 hypothetical protein D7Z94_08865 [Ulvibacterium marinum]
MKNKDIVPLIISIILMLVSFGKVLTSNYVLNQSHYIGMGCLIISTLLYFLNKRIYIYVFGLTLFGGLIGLLDFFYTTFKIGFAGIGVNPIFIALLILFFVFGKDEMNKLFPEKPTK